MRDTARFDSIHLMCKRLEKEQPVSRERMYGCAQCGSPFSAYPPDDIHSLASRKMTPSSEQIESQYVCANCKETTRLYWGKRAVLLNWSSLKENFLTFARFCRKLIEAIRNRQIPHMRAESGPASEESSLEDPASGELGDTVYNYILSNQGAINLSKASEELGIPAGLVRETIEKLSSDGRLKPFSPEFP